MGEGDQQTGRQGGRQVRGSAVCSTARARWEGKGDPPHSIPSESQGRDVSISSTGGTGTAQKPETGVPDSPAWLRGAWVREPLGLSPTSPSL